MLLSIIVVLIILSVQIYHPVDCSVIFLELQYPTNVTIISDNNVERWIDGNGFFIKPFKDKILIETPTFFKVACIEKEEEINE